MAKALAFAIALGACQPDAKPPASPARPVCAGALDELAKFYAAVATDQDSPLHLGLEQAEVEVGVHGDSLALATNARVADTSGSDYLVVGPDRVVLVSPTGEARPVELDLWTPTHGGSPTLVIAIAPKTPWRIVRELYSDLAEGDPANRYATIGFAYRAKGAFEHRKPPSVPGGYEDHVDLATLFDAIAKDTAFNCPQLAVDPATMAEGERFDAALLRTMGGHVTGCTCASNLSVLEAIPWLQRKPLVAVEPIGTSAGDRRSIIETAPDDATWGSVVHDNGDQPLAIPPPPPRPPPPPPPPPRPKPPH